MHRNEALYMLASTADYAVLLQDLYGRSKTHAEELLRGYAAVRRGRERWLQTTCFGRAGFDCAIIVRTSIIGRQLGSTRGMVEWILGLSHASPSSINGCGKPCELFRWCGAVPCEPNIRCSFTGVEWNGLTTVRLAHCLLHVALHPAPPRCARCYPEYS